MTTNLYRKNRQINWYRTKLLQNIIQMISFDNADALIPDTDTNTHLIAGFLVEFPLPTLLRRRLMRAEPAACLLPGVFEDMMHGHCGYTCLGS